MKTRILTSLYFLLITVAAVAQPTVTSVTPARNALDVAANSNITITFSAAMDEYDAETEADKIVVNGSLSGVMDITRTLDGAGTTLTIDPANDFIPGELVTVTIRQILNDAQDSGLQFTQDFSFTVATGGTGVGYFTSGGSIDIGSLVRRAHPMDADNDGDIDMYVVTNNTLRLYRNDGSNNFSLNGSGFDTYSLSNYGTVRDIQFRDLNNDGELDVVAMFTDGENDYSIAVWTKSIVGYLSLAGSYAITGGGWDLSTSNRGFTFGDVNRDQYLDILPWNLGQYGVRALQNNGDGTFSVGSAANAFTVSSSSHLVTGDFNNDGFTDFVGAHNDTLSAKISTGVYTFAALNNEVLSDNIAGLASGDFDNDGWLDVYVAFNSGDGVVYFNDGDGTFTAGTPRSMVAGATPLVADVNGDGDLDLIYHGSTFIMTAFNDGNGNFPTISRINFNATSIQGMDLIDWDGDGDLDFVYHNNQNSFTRVLNQGSGSVSAPTNGGSFYGVSKNYGTSIDVNYYNSPFGGQTQLIIAKAGSAVDATPVDGSIYTPSSTFGEGTDLGGGNFVVYNSVSSTSAEFTFNISGLATGTTYHLAMFDYNGAEAASKYRATAVTGNFTTSASEGYTYSNEAGQALVYDGSSYASVSDSYGIGDAFTIEHWVKPTVVGVDQVFLTYGNERIWMGIDASNRFYAMHENDDTPVTITGTSTVSVNNWYHVAVSGATDGDLVLHVNGVQEATASLTTSSIGSDTWWMGTDYDENKYFTGHVDEFRVWSVVRSTSDIRAFMNRPLSGFATGANYYWQFNGDDDSDAADVADTRNVDIGSISRTDSGIPFGNGTVESAAAVTSGETTIGNVKLNLSEGFDNAVDVQVVELTTAPNSFPGGYSSGFAGKYFVIDLFGDPGTFSVDLTFDYGAGVVTNEMESNPSLLKLYKRPTSSSGTWDVVGSATTAVASTGLVTFSGITSFSQFLILEGDPFYLITQGDTTITISNLSEYYAFTPEFFGYAEGYEDSTITFTLHADLDRSFVGENATTYHEDDSYDDYAEYQDDEFTFVPSVDDLGLVLYGTRRYREMLSFTLSTEGGRTASVDIEFLVVETAPELVGTDNENGWTMLTSPLQGTLGSFLSPLWTQGAVNSDYPAGGANIFTYNDTLATWEAFTGDLNATDIQVGKGYAIYAFADDTYDDGNPAVDGGWPKTLNGSGAAFGSEVTMTFRNKDADDSESLTGDEGWMLIGNPFGYAIRSNYLISEIESAVGEDNVNSMVYYWSPVADAWQGTTGSRIPAYQGFFIRITGPDASADVTLTTEDLINETTNSLTVGTDIGGIEGEECGECSAVVEEQFELSLQHTESGLSSNISLTFSEKGRAGIDSDDVFYLWPLSTRHANLYMGVGDQSIKGNNLPREAADVMEFPVYLESTVTGSFTLNWNGSALPVGMVAELEDLATGVVINLRKADTHTFDMERMTKRTSTKNGFPDAGKLSSVGSDDPVFILRIRPTTTSTEQKETLPMELALSQNFPNPFNPSTQIGYALPEQSVVRLDVYDVLGRRVASLINGEMQTAGRYTVSFDAASLASGVYIYRLTAGSQVITKRMLLIK